MEQLNSKSVAALTLGVLSVAIPYLGIVLGVIGLIMASKGLREIARSGEKGRPLAIAGRICSIVGVCIQGIVLAFLLLGLATFITYR